MPGIGDKDQVDIFISQSVYMYVSIFNLYLGVSIHLSAYLPDYYQYELFKVSGLEFVTVPNLMFT